MSETRENVKVIARSPGRFPVLIVETPAGELLATHFETRYDLDLGKSVEAGWVRENAIGRHSFIEVEPPESLAPEELFEYASR
ncbi:Hypothetical Protein RradSPS_0022 [Rubrobacter radiotolerans]|uniref:Uncharacterized protein n=1 Tax=Rubrobacter radiotolerans TaxID=42256 RepID=A0A023WZW1_RUBRA|nr:hypothetical protein [Rubrobacter radiotolerans]AHY45305.1 Hypothetical Protein RradSPS_0022 [Rubrobacter radiotolerans]MDX5892717.1 hypothetical protein [Rubrobacter radiotolerans]SMC02342.1 conserved hypothetical protein [Rubrobacter radiotolerans DSM 5868]